MYELMDLYELVDIWRILNPDIEKFTFRQKTPLIQTRLDYFLISNNIQDFIVKTDIVPSIRSDHSAVIIYIKHLQDQSRGSGHWKFNSSLIYDQIYIDLLESKILSWINEYSTIKDKRVRWDILKYEIRKFTMSFCSKKKKEKHRIQDLLIAELENTHISLAVNPSIELQNRVDELSQQLREIEDHFIKGNIIRLKIQ